MICERCWGKAYTMSLENGKFQTENYSDLIKEAEHFPYSNTIADAILNAGYIKKDKVGFDISEIRGAVAQAYCTERNSHKVLDPDLLNDAVDAIISNKDKIITFN